MESDIVLKQASRIWNLIFEAIFSVMCIWHKHFILGNAELNSHLLSQNLSCVKTFNVDDYVKFIDWGTTAAFVGFSIHLCFNKAWQVIERAVWQSALDSVVLTEGKYALGLRLQVQILGKTVSFHLF